MVYVKQKQGSWGTLLRSFIIHWSMTASNPMGYKWLCWEMGTDRWVCSWQLDISRLPVNCSSLQTCGGGILQVRNQKKYWVWVDLNCIEWEQFHCQCKRLKQFLLYSSVQNHNWEENSLVKTIKMVFKLEI